MVPDYQDVSGTHPAILSVHVKRRYKACSKDGHHTQLDEMKTAARENDPQTMLLVLGLGEAIMTTRYGPSVLGKR